LKLKLGDVEAQSLSSFLFSPESNNSKPHPKHRRKTFFSLSSPHVSELCYILSIVVVLDTFSSGFYALIIPGTITAFLKL
jgi:hypothetical protein